MRNLKRRVQCDVHRPRAALIASYGLDDLTPGMEHAEALMQWQSRAVWLMWEAAFGLALWHSGDSAVEADTNRNATLTALISVNDKRRRTGS